MIRLDHEQGSPEWIAARLGIPTASQFHRIISPKKLELSKQADSYAHELLAEWLLGCSLDDRVSSFMERGRELEDSAICFYELESDLDTEQVGFCMRDDGLVGASPDRLVGAEGGLEIKCPSAKIHVGYLVAQAEGTPIDYMPQVQGGMWITGRQWWDFLSYHPTLPPVLVRIQRDDEYIAALSSAVEAFIARLASLRERLVSAGTVPLKETA